MIWKCENIAIKWKSCADKHNTSETGQCNSVTQLVTSWLHSGYTQSEAAAIIFQLRHCHAEILSLFVDEYLF